MTGSVHSGDEQFVDSRSTVKWVGILPIIDKEFGEACKASMSPSFGNHVYVANNVPGEEEFGRNLGVPGSWNMGVDHLFNFEADWLVIISAAIRFGPEGGKDFIRSLGRMQHRMTPPPAVEADDGLGWHLIAFHRTVFEVVGRFDENFYPAYGEDNDMSWRIQIAFGLTQTRPVWPKVKTDATLVEVAHGIKRSGVAVDFVRNDRYFIEKWGGPSGYQQFDRPFNNRNFSLDYWPDAITGRDYRGVVLDPPWSDGRGDT